MGFVFGLLFSKHYSLGLSLLYIFQQAHLQHHMIFYYAVTVLLDSYKANPAKGARLSLTLLMAVTTLNFLPLCSFHTMKWDGSQCVGEQFMQGDQHIGLPKCKSLLVQCWEQGTMMDEKGSHAQFSQHPPCCARAAPRAAESSWDQLPVSALQPYLELSWKSHSHFPQILPSFPFSIKLWEKESCLQPSTVQCII